MKRTLIVVAALFSAALCFGQGIQALPNDPEVKTGKLDNGMTYYIRHNEKPAQRAEFYLATNVGAIQEGEGQDGLAHFLEHMCFNGLKNLPGKQMLDYLQNIGAEFGRNINASTGVEQTQYMLNNIPVIREGIIDTCLLIMHDYSHFVLNEPEEIDAERGVILEEKRTRNTASWRMFEKSAPYYYGDSKYATCNIIGSEQTLKTFTPETIKDYYETWYRPDMQALIVVGDIDVDQIYNKIVKLFADIPAPEHPTEKIMPAVPLNDEPVVGILTDPENTQTQVEFIWKTGEPTPKEIKGTAVGYMENILKYVISSVMSERFNDIVSKPGAPFLGASFGVGELSKTCEAVFGNVVCDNAKTLEACKALLVEIEKAKRYGFTDDEVDRVKEDIIKSCKDDITGKESRMNANFIQPIMSHFFNGTPYMDPETELQIAQAICAQINAQVMNQVLAQMITGEHLVIVYEGVDKPDQVHPTEEQLLALVEEVKNSDIQANAAEAINKDFMAGRTVKAGKIKKISEGQYGSQVWTLSNGLKVVVLPTEYKKDQIVFSLRKKGGLSLVDEKDLDSFDDNIATLFISNSGLADFSSTTVQKMLSGKSLSVYTSISDATFTVSGSSTPEDIETALQLFYLNFTAPRFDQDEWNVGINQLKAIIPNFVTTPDYVLSKHVYDDLYEGTRKKMISTQTIENANLETYRKYYETFTADIAGTTLYIVGNVDVESLKPLVEKYCASLPKGKKASDWNLDNVTRFVKGTESDIFKTSMSTPKVTAVQVYNADIPFTLQKSVNLKAASFILDMIYTATLREEEGGTYGASASVDFGYEPIERAVIQVAFETNTEQQETLRALAIKGLRELAQNGPSEEQLSRAIENAKKNLPENRITNSYWLTALRYKEAHGGDYDAEYEQSVNSISAEGIQAVLNEILSQNNFYEIVMLPEE